MTDLVPFLVNHAMLTQAFKFSCLADTASCVALVRRAEDTHLNGSRPSTQNRRIKHVLILP